MELLRFNKNEVMLKEYMNKDMSFPFGVEYEISSKSCNAYFLTVTNNRIDEMTTVKSYSGGMYEISLANSFIMPLYFNHKQGLQKLLDSIRLSIPKEGFIALQLLMKRTRTAGLKGVDMYASYLEGVDSPSDNGVFRSIQERGVRLITKLSPFSFGNQPDSVIESKITDDLYRCCIRVVTNVDIDLIKGLFKEFDYYNRLTVDKSKGFAVNEIPPSFNMVLSKKEIDVLLGQTEVADQPKVDTTALPVHKDERMEIDKELVKKIKQALIRTKVIKDQKIRNVKQIAGVRLHVVQFNLPDNVNITQIMKKRTDIQAELGVESLDIEQGSEPSTVKFSVPVDAPTTVYLGKLLEDKSFLEYKDKHPLAFPAGIDELNNPIYLSLSELVHLLIAGTTGSGKSVFLNSILTSLILNNKPEDIEFYMIDPKKVELSQYTELDNVEVITDMMIAGSRLSSLVEEMDRRYELMKDAGVKNIQAYKKKADMPYIVCVIDEYADLIMESPDVEDNIIRLGQKARAAGIHIIVATQRPSADILSSRLQANIQNAVSFNLGNNTNYRTVFGVGVPYQLLGKGDGVMRIEGAVREFQRFQSPIISTDETEERAFYESLKKQEIPLKKKVLKFIQDTEETRISEIQKAMGVRINAIQEVMKELTEEGYLIKHASRAKGYELVK